MEKRDKSLVIKQTIAKCVDCGTEIQDPKDFHKANTGYNCCPKCRGIIFEFYTKEVNRIPTKLPQ